MPHELINNIFDEAGNVVVKIVVGEAATGDGTD